MDVDINFSFWFFLFQKIEFDIAQDILAKKKAKLEQSKKEFFTPATLLKTL